MKRLTLKSALVGAALLASAAGAYAQDLTGKVYLLVPNVTTVRWAKFDAPYIKEALKKRAPGIELEVLNANDNVQQQVSQAEAAIANGALGIIIVAVDPAQTSSILAKADADGVPLVTYTHDPGNGPVPYHVVMLNKEIGEAHGKLIAENLPEHRPVRLAYMLGDPKFKFYFDQMEGFEKYLGPLIKDGTVEIVCRADAMLYLPQNAQKNMEQCLTKTGDQLDGVVVMNDDTGGGVIAALSAQDLVGKVKIYGGYDATLEGIQRVLANWQEADMAPSYRAMADTAAELILAQIEKKDPPKDLINGTWDNGFVKGGIPTAYTHQVLITRENVQETVIDAGLFTKEEVCSGIAKDAPFCTK